jgi:hypothetical protein
VPHSAGGAGRVRQSVPIRLLWLSSWFVCHRLAEASGAGLLANGAYARCALGKLLSPREEGGEKYAARARLPAPSHGVAYSYLTTLRSFVAVVHPCGFYEKLRHDGKLTTSASRDLRGILFSRVCQAKRVLVFLTPDTSAMITP